MTPLNHLRYRLLVHAPTRLSYRVDNGEVGLQRVERRDRRLQLSEYVQYLASTVPTA
jgi:hypothetical protein